MLAGEGVIALEKKLNYYALMPKPTLEDGSSENFVTIDELRKVATQIAGMTAKLKERAAQIEAKGLDGIQTTNWKSGRIGFQNFMKSVISLSTAIDKWEIDNHDQETIREAHKDLKRQSPKRPEKQ